MEAALILAGALVSGLVEIIKRSYNTSTSVTLIIVGVLSIVVALGFVILQHFGLFEAFLQIAITAGAVYAFFLKNVLPSSSSN
jgi:hypothetical protein